MADDRTASRGERESAVPPNSSSTQQGRDTTRAVPALPSITLPKGGGALRGIGEKLTVSPTGSATLTVPLPTSPARSSAGTPQLSLSYDSGAGNGPFGLGWTLSLPAIARKTEKALPRYLDGDDSDLFVLSGFEDLVPALVELNGAWVRDVSPQNGIRVGRYRPRVEGMFARIEHWTDQTGGAHWRSVTKDNVTTIYGRSPAARIADPADARRVYKWLIEETRDDKGNVVAYEYKMEDGASLDATRPEERNRLQGGAAFANRYLKRIHYGNHVPFVAGDWHFEIVFDYGEHDEQAAGVDEVQPWPERLDPFSSYRAGFEIRTYRLCRRVLLFHVFDALRLAPDGLRAEPQLVRSLELHHAEDCVVSTVASFVQSGYTFDDAGYHKKLLPALELGYTTAAAAPELQFLDPASAANLPIGLSTATASYQWVDLDSEGLSGVLTEQAQGWFYKRNLGGGQLGAVERVAQTPRSGLRAGAQVLDLAGDGHKYIVELDGPMPGYYRRESGPDTWSPFASFSSMPVLDWKSPFQRLIDLDGDGRADVLVTEDDVWSWYPSRGAEGFGARETVPVMRDEEKGPVLVFADPTESIFLADLSGDGLVDLVRVRNGEVCYWPNLGYGRFGAKVTMSAAPVFDRPELFDPRRVQFADVDGTGATDLLYQGRGEVSYWCNQAGNGWSAPRVFKHLPAVDTLTSVAAVDFLGNGTICIVWSSPSPRDTGQPLAYLDPMGGQKPYLLASVRNNLGAETSIAYAPSTRFYVEDRAAGQPWATRIPFPVHVVERVETRDLVSGNRFVATYSYHHGYYDGPEQEFRGFGRVDQLDTEEYTAFAGANLLPPGTNVDKELHVPPVLTRTWYHTGAFRDGERIATQFAHEYWAGDPHPQAALLDDTVLPVGLTTDEQIEACRALKGQILRQEIYGLDDSTASDLPYRVSERSYALRRVQPRAENPHAVFFSHAREALELHYERGQRGEPPDPRATHAVTLAVDDYGTVTRSIAIAYPRRSVARFPEQALAVLTIAENDVVNIADRTEMYRVGVPLESRSYEVVPASTPTVRYRVADVETILAGLTDIPSEAAPAPSTRRLLGRSVVVYYRDDLSGPAPDGDVGTRALTYETYQMALTPGLVTALWGARVTAAMLADEGGYVLRDGAWWAHSGRAEPSAAQFYLPVRFFDPFGNVGTVKYDNYALLPVRSETSNNPVLNNVVISENDYRTLTPWRITDPNGNRAAARTDELGLVIATAVMGKEDGPVEGDTLDDPTTRFDYDLTVVPAFAHGSAREQHGAANTRWIEAYEYSDGFGRAAQKKAQAEPDPDTGAPRWVGTGRTVFNNKGLPVKQYEPFFSPTSAYETEDVLLESGVTPIIHYDPLGRATRVEYPDGSLKRSEFDPWQQTTWDRNDTVLESRWYEDHAAPIASASDRRAAELTKAHANTPTIAHLDPLGRTFLVVANNGEDGAYQTRTVLDVQGLTTETIDHLGRTVMMYGYDMRGQQLYQHSMDGGERWMLLDVARKPVRSWDSRDHVRRLVYDRLQRPTHAYLATAGNGEILVQRTLHGELVTKSRDRNLRGKTYRHYDAAGVVTSQVFDFKDNLCIVERRLARDYTAAATWDAIAPLEDPDAIESAAEPSFEPERYAIETRHDALNRVISLITPDGSEAMPSYNEASLLDVMTVRLRHGPAIEFVSRIDYDAKGQRLRIEYNGRARTTYEYDPYTYRLIGFATTRLTDGARLQGLAYTYDPAGNILAIDDDTHATVYFENAVVTASTQYVYDPLYRLRHAEGREHPGLYGSPEVDHDDTPRIRTPHPNDGSALQRYAEDYEYDAVGNILSCVHTANHGSWNRPYYYDSGTNRLLWTDVASSQYAYDSHGSMTSMPHLASIQWNDRDEMCQVDLGGGGTAYYSYGADGQRTRKVIQRLGGVIRERIYLGGYEVYRERTSAGVTLERQTLHVMDDTRRIALVETLTRKAGVNVASPAPAIRYQLGNHLGSVLVELDEELAVLTYEEYYPFGSTSYQAGPSGGETSLKRYRYTGKERDEETDLYYYGARYYACWLGRWTAADPKGTVDGPDLYVYCSNNPIRLRDTTGTQSCDPAISSCQEPLYNDENPTNPRNHVNPLDAIPREEKQRIINEMTPESFTALAVAKLKQTQTPVYKAAESLHALAHSPPKVEPSGVRGAGNIAMGAASATIGVIIIVGTGGTVVLLGGAMLLATGVAQTGVGVVQAVTPMTYEQYAQTNYAADFTFTLSSSPGALVGGSLAAGLGGNADQIQRSAIIWGIGEGVMTSGLFRPDYSKLYSGLPIKGGNPTLALTAERAREYFANQAIAEGARVGLKVELVTVTHLDLKAMEKYFEVYALTRDAGKAGKSAHTVLGAAEEGADILLPAVIEFKTKSPFNIVQGEDMVRAMKQGMRYWLESGQGPPPTVRYYETGSGNIYSITTGIF